MPEQDIVPYIHGVTVQTSRQFEHSCTVWEVHLGKHKTRANSENKASCEQYWLCPIIPCKEGRNVITDKSN